MAAFSQFASDLDAATRAQLERGARLTELLKQGQYVPLAVEKQVVTVFAGTQGYTDGLPIASLGAFEKELHAHIGAKYPEIYEGIIEKKQLDKELNQKLGDVVGAFAKDFGAAQAAE